MAALGLPVVPEVYSQNAGESNQVRYGAAGPAAAPAASTSAQARPPTPASAGSSPAEPPMRTSVAASGARCMAARATAAHSGVATTTRARLAATRSPSSAARDMEDHGTG